MRLTNVIVSFGLAALPALHGASPWQPTAPLPRALAGQAAALRGDTLWIAGGSFWSADTKHLDTAVRRRTLAPPDGWATVAHIPGGFAHGGWAGDGTHLWLVGGLDEHGPSRAVRRIDLTNGRVETVAQLPAPRAYCAAVILGGALWVLGGTSHETDFSHTHGTVWQIDLATHAVRALPEPGPPSINPLVLPLGGDLHVLPGGVWSATTQRLEAPTEAWIFSPQRETWLRRSLPVALPRGLSGAALDRDHALLAGGVERRGDGTALGTGVWGYDARTGALAPQPALPAPRLAAAMISRENRDVWLLGGEDAPRSRVATVWRWSAESGGGK